MLGRTSTIATVIGSGLLLGACVAPADETTQARQHLVVDPLVFDTTPALEQPLKVEVEVEVDEPTKGRRGKGKEKGKKEKGEESAKKECEAKDEAEEETKKDDETKEETKDEDEEETLGTQASPIVVDAQCCIDGVCRWGPCDAPGYGPGFYGGGYPYGYDQPYYGGGYPYGYDQPYYGGGYPYGYGQPYYGYDPYAAPYPYAYGGGRQVTIIDERGYACDPYGGCVPVY